MIRFLLIIMGLVVLTLLQFVGVVPYSIQFLFFIIGIAVVGIPHGAADVMIANQHAKEINQPFSYLRFLVTYLSRLVLFGVVLWFFPLLGNVLFIFFAAFHFGETDLYQFNTNSFSGKLFVIAYGLLILGVILLNHFEEVQTMLLSFPEGQKNKPFLLWVNEHRYLLLSCIGILFFTSCFWYFAAHSHQPVDVKSEFLIRYAFIILILYHLPMLLGFTFYFVIWHSVLSLASIVQYLKKEGHYKSKTILQQICIYSIIALAGVCLFGCSGIMYQSQNTMMVYIFLGLAVLTAPHMPIMHDMYNSIRLRARKG